MFDNYMYRINRSEAFLAGYKTCKIEKKKNYVFLFTSLRFVRVTEGVADWKIGEKIYTVKKGDLIALNNIQPRQFVNLYGNSFECEIFAFSPAIFKNDTVCLSLFYNRADDFEPIIKLPSANSEQIDVLFDMLKNKLSIATDSHGYNSVCAASLIVAIAAEILSCITKEAPNTLEKSNDVNINSAAIVIKSIQYINDNIGASISVEDVAKNANISRGYLAAVFQKYIGVSPINYINKCKVEHVIFLMLSKDINVLNAAMESGFSSSSGFYKAFHKIYGTSPKKFLKNADS